MNSQRTFRRRIRKHADGVNIAADINAAINVNTSAVNTDGSDQSTVSRSVQNTAITQTAKTSKTSQQDREKR